MASPDGGTHDELTRFHLVQHTEAIRRDDARRRGRSTPSAESDIHEYGSDFFEPARVERRPQRTAEEKERSRRERDAIWAEEAKKGPLFGVPLNQAEINQLGLGQPMPYDAHRMVPTNAIHGEVPGSKQDNGDAVGPNRNGVTEAQWELHLEEKEDLKAGFGQPKDKAHDEPRQDIKEQPATLRRQTALELTPDAPCSSKMMFEQMGETKRAANENCALFTEQNKSSTLFIPRQDIGGRLGVVSQGSAAGPSHSHIADNTDRNDVFEHGVDTQQLPAAIEDNGSEDSPVLQPIVPPRPKQLEPHFPPNFPAYHVTCKMNEIAAYLANSSYVVSLGGPPLSDVKYGVIVVPVGEESLLFGPRPDDIFSQDFLDAVKDANDAHPDDKLMHGMEKDSDEFLRPRFRDDFPERSYEAHRNVEPRLQETIQVAEDAATSSIKNEKEETGAEGVRDEEMGGAGRFDTEANKSTAATHSTRTTKGLIPASSRTRLRRGKAPAPEPNTRKPQGITKTRSSSRTKGDMAATSASPAAVAAKKPRGRKKRAGAV